LSILLCLHPQDNMIIVDRNINKPSNAVGQIRIFVSFLWLLMTRCCLCPCTHSKAYISTSRLLLYLGSWPSCILYLLSLLSLHSFIFSFIDPWSISANSIIRTAETTENSEYNTLKHYNGTDRVALDLPQSCLRSKGSSII